MELFWDIPELARQWRRLAAIGRLIIFDRRGTGLSDPVPLDRLPDLEPRWPTSAKSWMPGSERAAILGFNEGGPLAMLRAASHRERCRALVLSNTAAKLTSASDYPWGASEDELLRSSTARPNRGLPAAENVARFAPSQANDPRFIERLIRSGWGAVSPGAVAHYFRQAILTDMRELLPIIEFPTLVLQRADGQSLRLRLAGISLPHADARFVELNGSDHLWFTENADELVGEVEEFLTGARSLADPDRRLATVLFTDIVGSTARAAALGDRRWRAYWMSMTRCAGELARSGGHEVDTAGDGFLVTFDGPGRAIRCARAISDALDGTGLTIGAGVHTGEVEVRGEGIDGSRCT